MEFMTLTKKLKTVSRKLSSNIEICLDEKEALEVATTQLADILSE